LKQLQQKTKEETFATKAQEYFDERAKIYQERENMKFDMYTEGFRRGFDMGYEKAKDQYYE
jgi:flagellar biosynthesis/type III secretory pathway protein FliH